MAITVSGTVITFNDATTQSTAASTLSPSVVTFNSSNASYADPGAYRMVRIQMWGGGGGAARSASAGNFYGGGGGGYNEVTVPKSYLTFPLSVTVAAGGAAATVNDTAASPGGTSQVTLNTAFNDRSTIQAFGGGGGSTAFACQYGGGGGGQLSAGTAAGTLGQPVSEGNAKNDQWHGGSGVGLGLGNTVFGGAGGNTGGYGQPTPVSLYGGNGGAVGNGAAGNGVQPGGGGGSAARLIPLFAFNFEISLSVSMSSNE
jgi:hypothetical protein